MDEHTPAVDSTEARRQRALRAVERQRAEGKKPGGRPGLPAVKREAIVAMRRQGMTPEKIAVAVEVSLSTVTRILRQAKQDGQLG